MLRLLAALVLVVLAGTGWGLSAAGSPPPTTPVAAGEGTATRILVNEVANGGSASDSESFAELRNWGDQPVDLTGWRLYRCDELGLRSNVGNPDGDLSGIVLGPGEVVTISRVGMPGDSHVTQPYGPTGFGLYLEAPSGDLVDRIGVYPTEPWPMTSECTPEGGNLPNVLDFARDESWQRVGDSGDPARDFLVARSTPGSSAVASADPPSTSEVVISEVSGAGPGGDDDEFVELRNAGTGSEAIGGWTFHRCTASGRLRPNTLELRIPDGVVLDPGESWIIGGPGFDGRADAHYPVGLADVEFGVLLRTRSGALVDRVAVSAYRDSACQGEDSKLAAILDPVAAESWQRSGDGWIVAPRTPGRINRSVEDSVFRSELRYPADPGVAISEIATDPPTEGMPDGSVQRNWIELGNYGDVPAEIGGWTIRRCQKDGTRAREVQVTIPRGTVLEPGEAYLVARSGTEAAERADARYDTALNFLGTGVWVADAEGRRVDSVGIYARNVLDMSLVTPSPCTKGVALTTYRPDRLAGESFQRSRFTGTDADDFVVGSATPGALDLVTWADPTGRADDVRGPATVEAWTPDAAPAPGGGQPVVVLEAWGGVSEGSLGELRGPGETRLDPAAPGAVADAGYGFPYQRLVLDAAGLAAGSTVSWSGIAPSRHEIQLSAWTTDGWRLVATGSSVDGAVRIDGILEVGDIREGVVTLLVQDGPRTRPTLRDGIDGMLQNPADYDLALSHITDTQYLTESYPEVYAQLVSWIADNAGDRKIEFATHTGDVVENWVNPEQEESRAAREFETASAIQGILEDADVRTSVLPGNHDNKRGVAPELFNEYFGPSRYEDEDWYGGSIAPDDNSANFSTFTAGGARFLMLSLPYAYGHRELTWAEAVIADHPDHNVVLSTHEHVTPKTLEQAAGRSTGSRWVSNAQDLWDRLVVPNRNVVLILSGHFHGLGQITTEDVGGVPGHTVVELLADYQEFRTHSGERATGFQRLLQIDLASGTVAADTFSVRLGASASYPYDYRQFRADNGSPLTPSNDRPWRIVDSGLQDRYDATDDEFAVRVAFQYDKSVATAAVTAAPPS